MNLNKRNNCYGLYKEAHKKNPQLDESNWGFFLCTPQLYAKRVYVLDISLFSSQKQVS